MSDKCDKSCHYWQYTITEDGQVPACHLILPPTPLVVLGERGTPQSETEKLGNCPYLLTTAAQDRAYMDARVESLFESIDNLLPSEQKTNLVHRILARVSRSLNQA